MNSSTSINFLNGKAVTCLSPFDRGLYYGHGLFETLRREQGVCPLKALHLARLDRGAAALNIPFDIALLEQYWQVFEKSIPDTGIVKIVLTSGQGGRGYRAIADTQPNYLLQWHQFESDKNQPQRGIAVQCCDYRLPDNPRLAGIKHLNRLDQVMASAEIDWRACQEGLLLDVRDKLVEGISHNIFLRYGNSWVTPDLSRVGVAGVMREHLLQYLFAKAGFAVDVRDIPLGRLAEADEIFMCNSVTGIWPVTAISSVTFPVGEQTRALQQRLAATLPCFAI